MWDLRQRAPLTHSRFTDSWTPFPFSCSRNLVLRTQSTFLLMVTTIGYWRRSGFAAPTSSAISWPPIFWGLTWWLSCAAGPRCGTSHRRIHFTRFTKFWLSAPKYSYLWSLTIFFSLLYFWCLFFGQLLMPHVRTSLQINLQARGSMLAAGGVFDKVQFPR